MAKFYLEMGLKITKIYEFIEFFPQKCFAPLAQEIVNSRRLADTDKSKAVIALTNKLTGNSLYSASLLNKEKHRNSPLSESAVLKRFKKRTKAKKLFKDATSKKNLDWNEDGQMLLDDRVVPGSHIDDLFQSNLKKRDPTLPGAREFESMLWESV